MTRTSKIRTVALAGVSVLALGIGGAMAQTASVSADSSGTISASAFNFGVGISYEQFQTGDVAVDIDEDFDPDGIGILIDGAISDAIQDVSNNRMTASGVGNTAITEVNDSGILNEESFHVVEGDEPVNGIGVSGVQLNFQALIDVSITAQDVGGQVNLTDNEFTETFTVNSNALFAVATGNDAESSISFDGIEVTGGILSDGEGTDQQAGSTLAINTATEIATGGLNSHLAILSLQGNVDTPISATIDDADVGIFFTDFADIAGGTLSVSRNELAAIATGSTADHAITVEAAGTFHANAGIASTQVNYLSPVTSQVGTAVDAVDGAIQVGAVSEGATIVTTRNRVAGSASGNVAAIEIDIEATDLQTTHEHAGNFGLAAVSVDFDAEVLGMQGGVTANNVQANIDSPVSSEVAGISIGALIATSGGAIDGSAVVVAGNRISSSAEGNVADIGVTLSGVSGGGEEDDGADTIGTFSAAIGSAQYSGDTVTATLSDSRIGILATDSGDVVGREVTATVTDFSIDIDADGLNSSIATVSGNVVQALARDNLATNVIEIGSGDSPFANLATSAAVVNEQQTSATVTATIEPGGGPAQVGILSEDVADGSSFVVQGNQLDARAEGNRALNAVSVSATQMGTGGFNEGTSASAQGGTASSHADYTVLNAQSNAESITASVTGATVGVQMGVLGGTGDMTGTLSTVSNNHVNAGAHANVATNQVAMATAGGGTGTAAISSSQVNSGAVTASVTGMMMGVGAGSTASASTNVVRGNSITASASGNTVVNRVSRSSF